jgi:SAM-dependent methyltransferase
MFKFLSRIGRRPEKAGFYSTVALSPDEIKQEGYKQFLGGGAEKWESRGAFQLYFLRKMGLTPAQRLLDIGCGPIRAGSHLIAYLNAGQYHGIDYNPDFIASARAIVASHPELAEKRPTLECDDRFGFAKTPGTFDFVLVFSVLNHCNREQIDFFLGGLHLKLQARSKAYVTHAQWFDKSMLASTQLALAKKFERETDVDATLKMEEWGWTADESIYPIIELQLAVASS